MKYPKCLNALIESLKELPGIGEKTAERLAFTMIDFKKDKLDAFSKAIIDIRNNIRRCSICNNITDSDICYICKDEGRNKDVICVVEDAKNVVLFEKNAIFDGKYHVLNGLISPFNGIKPEDSNIIPLLKRVNDEKIKEVVIAVKPTLEGEATSLYISKMLEGHDIVVSKIAQGIPMGADIEYLDAMTLENAMAERKKIS